MTRIVRFVDHLRKLRLLRFRWWFMLGGGALVVGALLLTDPDKDGLSTRLLLLSLATPMLVLVLAYASRKALHDYPEADARSLFAKAKEHPVGAGLALVALAIVMNGLLGLFGGARAQVPLQAYSYLSILASEQDTHWPDHPMPHYLAGLIDHESACPRRSTCWLPTARLKSAREEGAGLGQITRAFHPDGRTRFDALDELKARHPALREWSWSNVYSRPELQLRAVVLKTKDDYVALRMVHDPVQRLMMADAAYNGGLGGLHRERRACGMSPPCDPQKWRGHVENRCLKSRTPLYGGRSACDINRHHVIDVLLVRAPRYVGLV
jgi:hypothetical protein